MKLQLELSLRQDVINGFSYSYSKLLLEKLKKLISANRIFIKGNYEPISKPTDAFEFTPIAFSVIYHLEEQIQYPHNLQDWSTFNEVSLLIKTAEEFLAIFEVKTRKKKDIKKDAKTKIIK